MAELPWKSFAQPVPDREYVAILTYLPLTSFWIFPRFFYYTARIQSQVKSAPGLIGYSLLAHLLAKRFWTLSIWEDEAALEGFVRQQPHRQAMISLRRHMGDSAFTRWKLNAWRCRQRGGKRMEQLPKHARAEYRSIQRKNYQKDVS